MSNFNQTYSQGNDPQLQRRGSTDFRANGAPVAGMNANGVPMPMAAPNRNSGGPFVMGGFAGPRSPPKSKSTSHVPCKFFPHGTCQAGAACQFSHDLDPTTQNAPCKYFAKGSCKFGQNCALAHILPDGRVINRPPRGGQSFGYGKRMPNPNTLISAPQTSLLSMQANDPLVHQQPMYTYQPEGQLSPRFGPSTSNIPQLDTSYALEPSSAYGSPPNESRLGASPSQRGLSVLDAPLPSSFDSQGISHAARHGPFASSVPPRFGIESPPSSLPNRANLGNTALRDLHDSAFGDTANLDQVLHGLGSSPPVFDEKLAFSKRPLHSERFARQKMLSASLGTRPSHFPMDTSGSEESDDEGVGEDLLPSSLHDLLPQEKLRRFSRTNPEEENNPSFLSAQRRAVSSGHTPQDSKVGSMSPLSASPSRYNSIWSSRPSNRHDNDLNGTSAFGHVGSPLRPSALRTSSLNVASSPTGDSSPYVGSPLRQTGMSALTEQLQRNKLSDSTTATATAAKSAQASLHPGVSRSFSNGSSSGRNGLSDRGISSSSFGRETIEEEQEMFSMDGDDVELPSLSNNGSNPVSSSDLMSGSTKVKRTSNGMTPGKSVATLGPVGGQRVSK